MTGAAPLGGRGELLAATVVALAVGVGLLARADAGAGAQGAVAEPNVIVVLTDDQRTKDMLAMPLSKRRIGGRGVTFTRAWATFPLCCPSRATHLTGQYAHNHGVRDNVAPEGGITPFNDTATTATALDGAGYRTAFVGKYLNGYLALAREDPPYVPPGWDRWLAAGFPGRMWGWTQVVNGVLRTWGTQREKRHYQTDVLARQANSFVRSSLEQETPFFLTVATLAPHGEHRPRASVASPRPAPRHRHDFERQPLPKPESFNEADVSDKPAWVQDNPRIDAELRRALRARNRDRLASLSAVDELVAGLIDELREGRALQDTLVIFTSDNGFLMGQHRLRGKNVAYRESASVPLLARGAGLPKGAKVSAPVGNIDVAATIYDATGVPPAIEPDGISLLDVAADPEAHADRDLLIETTRSEGVRTPGFLYVEHESGDVELYDTGVDPFELDSVHGDPAYASIRAELAQRLDELRDCEGSECG